MEAVECWNYIKHGKKIVQTKQDKRIILPLIILVKERKVIKNSKVLFFFQSSTDQKLLCFSFFPKHKKIIFFANFLSLNSSGKKLVLIIC